MPPPVGPLTEEESEVFGGIFGEVYSEVSTRLRDGGLTAVDDPGTTAHTIAETITSSIAYREVKLLRKFAVLEQQLKHVARMAAVKLGRPTQW